MTKTLMTQLRITPLNRPIENHDWMDTPITPERQAASEAWQKQHAALREQFEREWVPPPGYSAERDAEEMTCIDCAAFDVWEERHKGRIVAASTPDWVDAFDYWLVGGPNFEGNGLLAKSPTAVSLTLPIVLKGGGDMQVTFETKKYVDTKSGPKPHTQMERKHRLVARTEHGVFVGHLKRECGERSWYVVSLPPTSSASSALSQWAGATSTRTPQEVADRVAKTLDAINQLNLADDYLAIMPISDHCSICSRPLKDIVSKTLGIGPDCSAQLGQKHSTAIADAIIAKRRAFLAEQIAA